MFKLKVVRNFKYRNFDKLKDVERYDKYQNQQGELYINDIITVETDDEVKYLCGENNLNFVACELIASETPTKPKEKKTTKKKGDK